MSAQESFEASIVVRTADLADDLAVLTERLGFRLDMIFPADSPATALVSGHGLQLRLERSTTPAPVTIDLVADNGCEPDEPVTLPGGSVVRCVSGSLDVDVPDNAPSLTITVNDDSSGIGRAGMRYRDLIPDRWGGRFISSHITIPDGGPVPDNVHFHRLRFQMIFVKAGWVRLVYQDQGPPFVMQAGDCVLQPPEIRHRVLESSPGLEVIEIGCPAEHPTMLDWEMPLPTPTVLPDRTYGGQQFVRHVADEATWSPWRVGGWQYRDTGIERATHGLAGARVARPSDSPAGDWLTHDVEFEQLVILRGALTFEAEDTITRLHESDSVAIPAGTRHRLVEPTPDCELLDVTLPGAISPE